MDYIFCSRNVRTQTFGTDPGITQYLEVPFTAAQHSPGHRITASKWLQKVVTEATSGVNPLNGKPVGDVLIYVHGFNNDLPTVLARHREIRKGLEADGFKGVVVSFDWPCDTTALAYLDDRQDAKKVAMRLVTEGIVPMLKFRDPAGCEISLHVLAHSMGSFVLREAFDDADDTMAAAQRNWTIGQMMLCGADVSAASLGDDSTSASFYRHAVRVTNYFNPLDSVLSISGAKRLGISPRAGRVGLPGDAPAKAVNVNVGDYYDANRAAFAHVPNSDHSFYFYDATMLRDIHYTLKGDLDRNVIPTRRLDRAGKLHLSTGT